MCDILSPGWGGQKNGWHNLLSPLPGLEFVLPETFRPLLRSFNLILALIASLTFAGNLLAADAASDFLAANRLYAGGNSAMPPRLTKKFCKRADSLPPCFFNYANAEFKSGHLGKAIAAYQQAAQLSPRDAELRANLAFVRNQVPGATLRESRWQNWVGVLTLNEGARLTAVLLWLTFALLIARQLRPALVPKLRTLTRVSVMMTFFSSTVLGLQAANHFYSGTAMVIADNATVRSGPFDDAQSAFTARDGAELSVLARREDWVQVADSAGKSGWLPAKQVEVLPGA